MPCRARFSVTVAPRGDGHRQGGCAGDARPARRLRSCLRTAPTTTSTSPCWPILASQLAETADTSVVRFNFPYVERGVTSPDPRPVLELTFTRVYEHVVGTVRAERAPVFVGGKSLGGRTAAELVSRRVGGRRPRRGRSDRARLSTAQARGQGASVPGTRCGTSTFRACSASAVTTRSAIRSCCARCSSGWRGPANSTWSRGATTRCTCRAPTAGSRMTAIERWSGGGRFHHANQPRGRNGYARLSGPEARRIALRSRGSRLGGVLGGLLRAHAGDRAAGEHQDEAENRTHRSAMS